MGFLDRLQRAIETPPDPEPARAPAFAPAPTLWERQPGEPDQAWLLFSAYLQSPSANVTRFAQGPASAGLGTGTIQAYAARWRWHVRRAALEQHLARARAAGADEAARAQGAQIAASAQALLDLRDRAQSALEARGGAEEISARDLIALSKTAIELARLVRGESTAHVRQDLSGLSLEELDALDAIARKVSGGGS